MSRGVLALQCPVKGCPSQILVVTTLPRTKVVCAFSGRIEQNAIGEFSHVTGRFRP